MNYNDFQHLTLNGQRLKGNEIVHFCRDNKAENLRQLGHFIEEWLLAKDTVKVRTSGSTGKPKVIEVLKNQMLKSAAATAKYFGFEQAQTALLCLPINYIAGKMMVVRALLSGLNLICIEPDNNPLGRLPEETPIHFAPLTPMQLKNTLVTGNVRKILLGGGPINPALEQRLQSFKAEIFHGYGMTETLSHIALRKVNGAEKSEHYEALPGVTFRQDERGCLVALVPFLRAPVITNDLVTLLNNYSFIWNGRVDNVVNSGGIKLFPEAIEKKLFPFLTEHFFVAGLPDSNLGEKLCLFIEGEAYSEEAISLLKAGINKHLEKYEKPKEILFLKQFSMTESGKIQRKKTLEKFLSE